MPGLNPHLCCCSPLSQHIAPRLLCLPAIPACAYYVSPHIHWFLEGCHVLMPPKAQNSLCAVWMTFDDPKQAAVFCEKSSPHFVAGTVAFLDVSNDLCGVACHNGPGGHVLCYYSPRCYCGPVPHSHAACGQTPRENRSENVYARLSIL
jgi:hypothetical protein